MQNSSPSSGTWSPPKVYSTPSFGETHSVCEWPHAMVHGGRRPISSAHRSARSFGSTPCTVVSSRGSGTGDAAAREPSRAATRP